MKQAPLIVGAGGINAAGRTSGHQGYKRLIFPHLAANDANAVIQDLAIRMGLEFAWRENPVAVQSQVLAGTLARDISTERPWTALRRVRTAALMPRGFDPGKLYHSHNHPTNIRVTVYAMADALASLGLPWEQICKHVSSDEISVYISEADANACQGQESVRYISHSGPADHERIHVVDGQIRIDGYPQPIALPDGEELYNYFR